jgi:hypothetical protein
VQNLYIDESLVILKGKLAFKQIYPVKTLQVWSETFCYVMSRQDLCLTLLNIEGLTPAFNSEVGGSGSVVTKLLQLYLICGHNLFVDNWYMSSILINHLKKGKGVLLHIMKVPGGRGGIDPTHSQPRH